MNDSTRDALPDADDPKALRRKVIAMSTPILLALLLMTATALVDSFFVAQLGDDALVGLGYALPITFLFIQLWLGFGAGVTAVVSQCFGRKQPEQAALTARQSLATGLAATLLLMAGSLVATRSVLDALGASGQVLDDAHAFLKPWLWALPFPFLCTWGTAVLRGYGDTRTTGAVFGVQAIINLFLCPLLTFGLGPVPALGIAGAGLATAAGYGVAALLTIRLVSARIQLASGTFFSESLRVPVAVLRVAGPAILTYVLTPLAYSSLVAIIAKSGDAGVAALGVSSRVGGVISAVPTAVAGGLAPLIGQGWGKAGDPERVRQMVQAGATIVGIWSVLSGVVLALVTPVMAPLFGKGAELISLVSLALWFGCFTYAAQGFLFLAHSIQNSTGRARRTAMFALLQQLALTVPLALVGQVTLGAVGVFAALMTGAVVTAAVAWTRLASDGFVGLGVRQAMPARNTR